MSLYCLYKCSQTEQWLYNDYNCVCEEGGEVFWISGVFRFAARLPQPAANLALATTFGTAKRNMIIKPVYVAAYQIIADHFINPLIY